MSKTATEYRSAIITGATGAIGKAIARQIAARPGFEVVLACRDEAKAKRTISELKRSTANQRIRYVIVDLSRRASIEALANRWHGPLHILVNNAATTPRKRQETPEGIELQFATNVLSYFWMIQAFTPKLIQAAPSRVVNVASYWAGGLDIDDLEFRRRRYHNDSAYRQSKQANRMLTVAFARRLRPYEISITACHPGDVNSTLSNNLGFGGHETPDQGAETPAWLATVPNGLDKTGKYFEHRHETRCRFADDSQAIEALYEACISYAGS
jgi:NAD(P)-dependent dehydrogenase (short-subunit alcohol dehydrogenase family)